MKHSLMNGNVVRYNANNLDGKITIGLVGKYVSLQDAYLSSIIIETCWISFCQRY